jgi:hypothetical protein
VTSDHRRMEGRLGFAELQTSQIGREVPDNLENAPDSQAISRNENGTVMDSPSGQNVTARRCRKCGELLPLHLRSDARYCPHGGCKQAAYRNRRAAER